MDRYEEFDRLFTTCERVSDLLKAFPSNSWEECRRVARTRGLKRPAGLARVIDMPLLSCSQDITCLGDPEETKAMIEEASAACHRKTAQYSTFWLPVFEDIKQLTEHLDREKLYNINECDRVDRAVRSSITSRSTWASDSYGSPSI